MPAKPVTAVQACVLTFLNLKACCVSIFVSVTPLDIFSRRPRDDFQLSLWWREIFDRKSGHLISVCRETWSSPEPNQRTITALWQNIANIYSSLSSSEKRPHRSTLKAVHYDPYLHFLAGGKRPLVAVINTAVWGCSSEKLHNPFNWSHTGHKQCSHVHSSSTFTHENAVYVECDSKRKRSVCLTY